MIDKIYETIADKTLSFGCRIRRYYNQDDTFVYIEDYGSYTEYGIIGGINKRFYKLKTDPIEFGKNIIIGHPVLINRVEWYLVYVNDYELVRQSLSTDELLLPVEKRNEESIKILFNMI